MDPIFVSEKISYIEGTDHPLSADIGMVKGENAKWLYDVGNGEAAVSGLHDSYNVVLSHFHAGHSDMPFDDVKESDYFAKAVKWAKDEGITAGFDATRFAPGRPCTRAEMVCFLRKV